MLEYKPCFLFRNKHINTCFPTLFRKINIEYKRERIDTPDGDFLDLDWIKNGNDKVIVLCHGLEGSSRSKYIQGTARYFSERGWDVLAINYRGCSGEMNRKLTFYHMGYTEDLETILKETSQYKKVALAGFSLGANLVLKYLGEREEYPKNLICGVAVSPPCELVSNSVQFRKRENFIYRKYFLKKLKEKVKLKSEMFPNTINMKLMDKVEDMEDFDNLFTAQYNGFIDAIDYYEKTSSINFIPNIKVKTLILTPLDDPIISKKCYPIKEADENKFITLEMPKYGGHVGFASLFSKVYWLEKRIYEYVNEIEENK